MYVKEKNTIFKKYFWILILICTIVVVVLFALSSNFNDYLRFTYFTNDKKIYPDVNPKSVQMKACLVPKLDPWDPTIMDLVRHPKGLHCQNCQPFMSYVDYNGYLRLNETETKLLHEANLNFFCNYSTFDRKSGPNDNEINFYESRLLTNSIKLTNDNVLVECFHSNLKKFYMNVHAHPIRADDRIFAEPTDSQLSVLIFLVDSVSFSAMQRNLPATYKYTKNVMGIKFFKGNKNGGDRTWNSEDKEA